MFLLDTCKEMYVVSGHFLANMLMQQSLAQEINVVRRGLFTLRQANSVLRFLGQTSF